MTREGAKLVSRLILVIAGLYCIHRISFSFFGLDTTLFEYSLEKLYLFFGIFSTAIIIFLLKVKQKDLDIVGNTFLVITSIKMVACYILARPILENVTQEKSLEKWNFFFLFLVFLMLETVATILLVNKKEN